MKYGIRFRIVHAPHTKAAENHTMLRGGGPEWGEAPFTLPVRRRPVRGLRARGNVYENSSIRPG